MRSKGSKHYRHWRSILAGVSLIIALGFAALQTHRILEPGCTEVKARQTVSLPIAELRPGTARTFCYRDAHGHVIRFIVARDSDGTVHSAFDACRSCFEYNLGYRLSGADMVCRFCGRRYKLKDMATGIASCVPIRLPHLTVSNSVQIKVADLEAGRRLFPD
jgi:uncharacterized membrane protein